MRQLYFAGGESTVIDEHYEILDKVIEMGYAGDMEVRYNSNGIELPDRLLEQWKHFKKVRFHYSIDSIGEMNDYIRYPSKWDHQLEMFKRLDTQTSNNVEVTIACAVNALNIHYIPDFLKWKLTESGLHKTNMWPFGAGGINYHFVYWPGHLNVKVLPDEFLDKTEKKYEEFIEWWKENWELGVPTWHKGKVTYEDWEKASYGIKRLRGMISFARSEDWSRRLPEFREYITKLDELRGTDFRKTFPDMAYLLDEPEDD
jgi:sulfatase maturation enzyme AslB (radical SAM superfamily)